MNNRQGHAFFLPGIEIWSDSRESLLEFLVDRAENGLSTVIVTLNPLMVLRANQDKEFDIVLRDSDVIVCDGQGIKWAFMKLNGGSIPLIPGVELAEWLIEESAKRNWRVFLLGAKDGIWQRARDKFASKLNNSDNVSGNHGYFSAEDELSVVKKINELQPHLIVVGMGFPRQEKFLHDNRDQFTGSIMIGAGGSLDVFAGEKNRAPMVFRKLRLEWLWRTIKEPKRFRSIKDLLKFILLVILRHESLLKR